MLRQNKFNNKTNLMVKKINNVVDVSGRISVILAMEANWGDSQPCISDLSPYKFRSIPSESAEAAVSLFTFTKFIVVLSNSRGVFC